jgi:hypothetical protein
MTNTPVVDTKCPFCGADAAVKPIYSTIIYQATLKWWDICQRLLLQCTSCGEEYADEKTYDFNYQAIQTVVKDSECLAEKITQTSATTLSISNNSHPSHQITLQDGISVGTNRSDIWRRHYVITLKSIKTAATVEFLQASGRKRGIVEHLLSLTDDQCRDYLKKISTKDKQNVY